MKLDAIKKMNIQWLRNEQPKARQKLFKIEWHQKRLDDESKFIENSAAKGNCTSLGSYVYLKRKTNLVTVRNVRYCCHDA